MKIIVPFECSLEEIEKVSAKYGVNIESLPNVELSIIGSPLYTVTGSVMAVDGFVDRYMSALGCKGDAKDCMRKTESQTFVYWEKLGEKFGLSYHRDEDYFAAKKDAQATQKKKRKKGSSDDEEVVILRAPEAEKPKVSIDMSELLR